MWFKTYDRQVNVIRMWNIGIKSKGDKIRRACTHSTVIIARAKFVQSDLFSSYTGTVVVVQFDHPTVIDRLM